MTVITIRYRAETKRRALQARSGSEHPVQDDSADRRLEGTDDDTTTDAHNRTDVAAYPPPRRRQHARTAAKSSAPRWSSARRSSGADRLPAVRSRHTPLQVRRPLISAEERPMARTTTNNETTPHRAVRATTPIRD